MPTSDTQKKIILQSINEAISFHDKLYCSNLKELSISITAKYGRNEYSTILFSTKYIADPRDALSELIKTFIQQDLYQVRGENENCHPILAEDFKRIERWLLSH